MEPFRSDCGFQKLSYILYGVEPMPVIRQNRASFRRVSGKSFLQDLGCMNIVVVIDYMSRAHRVARNDPFKKLNEFA